MAISKISWTVESINPVTGCDKYSLGCLNCYMFASLNRWKKLHPEKYGGGAQVTCHSGVMEEVLKRKKSTRYFVGSMSDLFHRDVPLEFLQEIFEVMEQAPQHEFILLTKRTRRLVELAPYLHWPTNIRMGATVEASQYLYRVEHLKQVPAHVRWLSLEPLLTPMYELNAEVLKGINWIVVGGESGSNPRPMQTDWVRYVRDLCQELGIPFFFKQHGEYWGRKAKGGNVLDGKIWEQHPAH